MAFEDSPRVKINKAVDEAKAAVSEAVDDVKVAAHRAKTDAEDRRAQGRRRGEDQGGRGDEATDQGHLTPLCTRFTAIRGTATPDGPVLFFRDGALRARCNSEPFRSLRYCYAAAASSPCMKRIAIVLALVLLLAAAGCTSPGTSPVAQDTKYSNSGTVGGALPADRSAGSGEAVAPGTASTVAPIDPKLIRNADLRVEVPSLEPALDRVRSIAADQNGTVAGLEVRAESGSQRTATVTVRVPEDRFDATLAALRAVGTVRSESVQAQDVTEEYVDLGAKRDSLSRQLEQCPPDHGQHDRGRPGPEGPGGGRAGPARTRPDRGPAPYSRAGPRSRGSRSVSEEPAPLAGGALPSIVEVLGTGIQGFFAVLAGLVILVITLLPLALIGGAAWLLYRRYRRSKA